MAGRLADGRVRSRAHARLRAGASRERAPPGRADRGCAPCQGCTAGACCPPTPRSRAHARSASSSSTFHAPLTSACSAIPRRGGARPGPGGARGRPPPRDLGGGQRAGWGDAQWVSAAGVWARAPVGAHARGAARAASARRGHPRRRLAVLCRAIATRRLLLAPAPVRSLGADRGKRVRFGRLGTPLALRGADGARSLRSRALSPCALTCTGAASGQLRAGSISSPGSRRRKNACSRGGREVTAVRETFLGMIR